MSEQGSLVDESGGKVAVERRYASLVGLPLRRLPRDPGSITTWENHAVPTGSAFVVELPPGALSTMAVRRHANTVIQLAKDLTRSPARQ